MEYQGQHYRKYGQMRFRRNLFQLLSETRLIFFTEQFRLKVNVDAHVLYILDSNKLARTLRLTLALTRFPDDCRAKFCTFVTFQRKTHFIA